MSDESDAHAHDSSDGSVGSTQASVVTTEDPYVVVLVDAHTHHVSFPSFVYDQMLTF
jgi:hypothetical protein